MELACLNSQIASVDFTIDELERHALVLDCALASLCQTITTHKSMYLSRRNGLVPINSLPNEVLINVLDNLVTPVWESLYSDVVDTGVKTLHQLAMVCKRWSQVVKGTPQLWATLGPGPRKELELKIRKSGPLPLFVHSPHTSGPITKARGDAKHIGGLEFLSLAQILSHRWKVASLFMLDADGVHEALVNPSRTPIMESFAVGYDRSSNTSALFPYYSFPPMLRHLHLNHITPMAWGPVPPSFESFQLSEATYPSPKEYTPVIAAFLQTCLWLQELHLELVGEKSNGSELDVAPIILHRLKKLVLWDIAPHIIKPLLKAIQADNLSRLVLDHASEAVGAFLLERSLRTHGAGPSLLSAALSNSSANIVKIYIQRDTAFTLQAFSAKGECVWIGLRSTSWSRFLNSPAGNGRQPIEFPINIPIDILFTQSDAPYSYHSHEGMLFIRRMPSLSSLSLDCSLLVQVAVFEKILSIPYRSGPEFKPRLPCPKLAEVHLANVSQDDPVSYRIVCDATAKLLRTRREAQGVKSSLKVYTSTGEIFDEGKRCFA